MSSSGGSLAAQAFKEQLAREAGTKAEPAVAENEAVPPAPAAEPAGAARRVEPGKEARTAVRKLVSGRARFTVNGGGALAGKMVDISVSGACVLMEDMGAVKKVGTLECDVFLDGKSHVFSLPVVCVYSVLASGKGFKVGFQFGSKTAAASKVLEHILV